jgi:UPF0716 protein FxsA
MSFLPLFILAYPLLEIAVLIMVGSSIGILATLMLIIGTGVLGAMLLRFQGFQLVSRMRSEMNAGRMPEKELADGAMIALGGVFLMIPGFVSDVIGILLFIPPFRAWLRGYLGRNVKVVRTGGARRSDGVVDLDADEYHHNEGPRGQNGSSPWQLPQDKK